MPANDYHFLTRWRVPAAAIDEVYAVLTDPEALPQWWPSVYLAVDPAGTLDGKPAYALHTKGWLPYTLRWTLTADEAEAPAHLKIGAHGDFEGRGIWTLTQDGPGVLVEFDWKLTAQKPLLKLLSPLLKPAFSANHRWAMARGEASLRCEVQRRRRPYDPAPASPPGPTTWEPWLALGVGAAVLVGVGLAVRGGIIGRARKRHP